MTWFQNLRELLTFSKQDTCLCMVVSEQEGADIFVNDQATGFQTPHAIPVPRNTEVKVTLKLLAHFDHTAYIKSGHHLSYYHCQLTRVPLRLISNEDYNSAYF